MKRSPCKVGTLFALPQLFRSFSDVPKLFNNTPWIASAGVTFGATGVALVLCFREETNPIPVNTRKTQGAFIAAAIVTAIGTIAAIANVNPVEHKCPWDYTFGSCILSARETLMAGLIAAGGALFAAWLAWTLSEIRSSLS